VVSAEWIGADMKPKGATRPAEEGIVAVTWVQIGMFQGRRGIDVRNVRLLDWTICCP
jgi:hypothetical protein